MTSALRLFTAGSGVSEGRDVGVSEGVGVSVKATVGVAEAVSVEAGGVNDSVGRFGVWVGATLAVGTEGAVRLQANEANIQRVKKASFCFIGEVFAPFPSNGCEL